ncbi:C1-like protein [Artemisia annua]|uniref:C1-like protein n=1 Tax=Artemisia annua TaxID=35608 RepID=A0A2U1L7B6_ARTAN|nr:C1-like protein [Artemisia annua]
MNQGNKHFSHPHNLVLHQLPQGVDLPCSGCNSSSTGTIYICWPCNFYLHEQCYHATRSMEHPSHPLHPLTLVPYPTYLSNSFYCNSCKDVGTGFSYSCADCEFDLHVQCAYSTFITTNFQTAHLFQELVPSSWKSQHPSMSHNIPFVSAHDGFPSPFTSAQNPDVTLNFVSNKQHHSTSHDQGYGSIPPSRQNSISTAQDPYMAQNGPSVSIPMSSQNPIPIVHDPSMAPNGLSVSKPMSSQNLIASVQYPPISQNEPSASTTNPPNPISTTQDPTMLQNRPFVSIHTSSQNTVATVQYPSISQNEPSVSILTNPPNPIPSTQDPPMPQNEPSVSIHSISQNPAASTQYASMAQTEPSTNPSNPIPKVQDSPIPQNVAYISIPSSSPNPITSSQDLSVPQNEMKDKGITHFSHPHKLAKVDIPEDEDEENEVTCSGCEDTLVGKGYSCVEPKCDFHLHETCFNLKRVIQHKSHPEHPLTLLPVAPYNNKNGEFTCNACFSDGTGFTYNCSVCTFDLHTQCVSLPETVKRSDHEHVLKLCYSCPVKSEDHTVSCDVCHGDVQNDRWAYYCDSCDYATHLGCVDCEECEEYSIIDAQAQLQRLQLQMEMARQQAQFMAGLGASLSSLV